MQTILERSMKGPDYLIDLTNARERGKMPMTCSAMKVTERKRQEVDAVRKELGPKAAAQEQKQAEEKPEMEQEGPAVLYQRAERTGIRAI